MRFGQTPSVAFWRVYFRWVVLGERPNIAQLEPLVADDKTLEPYLALVALSKDAESIRGANKLYEAVKDGVTERQRYVRSVVESLLRNAR